MVSARDGNFKQLIKLALSLAYTIRKDIDERWNKFRYSCHHIWQVTHLTQARWKISTVRASSGVVRSQNIGKIKVRNNASVVKTKQISSFLCEFHNTVNCLSNEGLCSLGFTAALVFLFWSFWPTALAFFCGIGGHLDLNSFLGIQGDCPRWSSSGWNWIFSLSPHFNRLRLSFENVVAQEAWRFWRDS